MEISIDRINAIRNHPPDDYRANIGDLQMAFPGTQKESRMDYYVQQLARSPYATESILRGLKRSIRREKVFPSLSVLMDHIEAINNGLVSDGENKVDQFEKERQNYVFKTDALKIKFMESWGIDEQKVSIFTLMTIKVIWPKVDFEQIFTADNGITLDEYTRMILMAWERVGFVDIQNADKIVESIKADIAEDERKKNLGQ